MVLHITLKIANVYIIKSKIFYPKKILKKKIAIILYWAIYQWKTLDHQ